ncbi:hypothetical protein PGT21_013927 [Puccinia graminis f. sp. tritici]|uniref:Uncharacterized protein n=1 Tax=Puccinia graminis f. sp. tritici TaxID=56615 RepID=A0A5B0N879_PUCGR|nr:hypothetical protein PGT21_013927 [Puccinia graminis f. sp. tritici]
MYSPRLAPRPVTSSQNASKSPRSKSPSQQANFGRMSNVLVIVHTDCQEVQHVLSIGHNNWTRRQRSLSVSFATMIETTILWIFITLLPFHRNGDTKNGASRHPRHFGRVVKAIDSNQLDSSSIGISRAGSNPAEDPKLILRSLRGGPTGLQTGPTLSLSHLGNPRGSLQRRHRPSLRRERVGATR